MKNALNNIEIYKYYFRPGKLINSHLPTVDRAGPRSLAALTAPFVTAVCGQMCFLAD